MSKNPKTKRRKVWYCIECNDYIEPNSRHYHNGHKGRYGHPTTAFFERMEKFRMPNGEEVWMEKREEIQGLLKPWKGIQ